jgi:hypothetical protein
MNDLKKSDLNILSQIYALFIEFYYALFFFFKDMHYNTMIRTFCILKKMTFGAFHYLSRNVTHFRRSPVFDGLFHVIKSLIILIASFVRGYILMLKLHE